MALSFALSLALSNPGDTQTCQKISVGDNDALGCFNYAVLNRSDAFFDGDQLTVYWEASHTGANELHFGLSSATTTETGDDDHRVEGDGGTDRGRHTLNYRVQHFYELLMYPNGGVQLRRPGPNLPRWRAYARGSFDAGFSYNTEGDSHRFWTLYNRASGLYRFGVGTTAGQNQVLTWTDPNPVDVRFVSANVYCCGQGACDARAHDEGFFCMCTGSGQDCGDGLGPPTTPFPSGSPTTSAPVTAAPTTAAPTTAQPTATPSTTPPSPEPTLGPTFHPCTDGTHTCDTDTAYCAVHPDGGSAFTCECNQGLTRLTDTSCIRTARPTAAPTTPAPTTSPTTSPTASAPSSNPSSMPTISSPTGFPTKLPTYAPVAATADGDAAIDAQITADPAVVAAAAELRAAEADLAALAQAGATQAEIDIATTAVQERRADHTAAVSAARAARADAGGSEDNVDGAGSSGNTTPIVAVVAVTLLIVVGVIVGAVMYVKHGLHHNAAAGQHEPRSFDNPTYGGSADSANGAPTPYEDVRPGDNRAAASSGYMDVPAAAAAGYMDVSPAGFNDDDDAEDV